MANEEKVAEVEGVATYHSFRESIFRLAVFVLACLMCVVVLFVGLAYNPKQFFTEGYGYVVFAIVMFGVFALAELGSLLLRLKRYFFG